jgi:hypothetical protein
METDQMERSEIKIGDKVALKPGLLGAGKPMTVVSLPLAKLVRCVGGHFGEGLHTAGNLVRLS